MSPTVLRPRWARLVGGVWLAAGGALVLAGLLGAVTGGALGLELLAGPLVAVAGWWYAARRVEVDATGVEQGVGWRRTRLLWSVVDHVVVPAQTGPRVPLVVALAGRGAVELAATRGLSRTQWQQLLGALDLLADETGLEVVRAD